MDDSSDRVLIGIMGTTGSGKTTFINSASGFSLVIGEGLTSCTTKVDVAPDFELDDRRVTLIDTPGFDDTNRSDAEVLNSIATHLENSYAAGIKLSGLIYFHRISDYRMGCMSVRNFHIFRKLCGDETLKNVVIVTNMWGDVGLSKGEAREEELRNNFFKQALNKGAKMLRHDNTTESAHTIIRHLIQNHPLPLKIQRELVDEKKPIEDTATAAELEGQIQEMIKKQQAEMRQLHDDFQEAVRAKDVETKRELQEAERYFLTKIDEMKDDVRNMYSKHEDERWTLDEYWRHMLQSVFDEKEEQRRVDSEALTYSMMSEQQDLLSSLVAQMQLDRGNADRGPEGIPNDQEIAEQYAEMEARLMSMMYANF